MKDRDQPEFIEVSGPKLEELLALKQEPIAAIPTPFPKWNSRCRDFGGGIGLARGWHVTIGGNTGHGKSLLALNMAKSAAEYAQNVGFVSLEMSWPQLATRYMSIVSGEHVNRLEPGKGLDVYAHQRAGKAVQKVTEKHGGRLFTNERQISQLEDVEDAILFLYEFHGCRFIVVDYMQLVKVVSSRDPLDAVTAISSSVRWTGHEHQLVTIGLSQFNRETSKNYEDPPTPQGLMGGSPLENDSDQVLLIDHSSYARHPAVNTAKQTLLLGKNRHGPAGPIECEWNYDNLRITEIGAVTEEPARRDERSEIWEPEELPLSESAA